MLLPNGVPVEFLFRWIRVAWIPLPGYVSLKQAGAILLAGVWITAWLQNVLLLVLCHLWCKCSDWRACRASPHTSGWGKGHLWFTSLVLDASPMETLVHWGGFVNTLLAAAVLMEEGTDCLAQLVKRASLYLFSNWSSKSKWDHFIPNVVVLEINRILQKSVRWWVITSVTERDKKRCSIQSVNQ